jgi:DNA-binding transcriptional MerR regulator
MVPQVNHLSAANLAISSPELGTSPVTVGQIAEHLRSLEPDVPASTDRLRYWTEQDLLRPINQKRRTGTGKHRQYDVSTIVDAAVLIVVTKSGLQIAGSLLRDIVSQARQALQNWNSGDLYLQISYATDPLPTIDIHQGRIPTKPTGRVTIVLNLLQIISDAKLHLKKRGSQ